MLATNHLTIVMGLACLGGSVWILRKLVPKQGEPQSAWTSTNLRASVMSIVILSLLVTGVGLLVQGATS